MQLPRKMSAQEIIAKITRTFGGRKKEQKNEIRYPGEAKKNKFYKIEYNKKMVRIMTVMAYIVCVSLIAVLLSLYYTFIWNPKVHRSVGTKNLKAPDCMTIKISESIKIPSFYETQVKKVTAKSTTMNDIIADDSSKMSTTTGPREKSLLQILTKSVKSKELSSTVASTELHRTVDVVTITEPYEENKNRN